MKRIDLGGGVLKLEMEENETVLRERAFSWEGGIVEIHIPEGVTEIGEGAFSYCRRLERVYLPKSVTLLGKSLFYGLSPIEIYYAGSAADFEKLAKPYKKMVEVQVTGPYDKQPYCNTAGTYYTTREEWCAFDSFCADCSVVCADGTRLSYGYSKK